jgi:hypothetical protein
LRCGAARLLQRGTTRTLALGMAYVLQKDGVQESVPAFKEGWQRYRDYLASISSKLPAAARDFALADWHYDFRDHRAPHDAWVESVAVIETGSGERQENRSLDIKLRLLGAYHDGHIELEYKNVFRYNLGSTGEGHGDWMYDEVRLSEAGHVLHEIEIGGTTWVIECEDISYGWYPRANSTAESDARKGGARGSL